MANLQPVVSIIIEVSSGSSFLLDLPVFVAVFSSITGRATGVCGRCGRNTTAGMCTNGGCTR